MTPTTLIIVALALSGVPHANGKFTYVNYSPDTRYSDADGRTYLVVDFPNRSYSYGHNFGVVGDCDSRSDGDACISLGFIKILEPVNGCRVGERHQMGQTEFTTTRIEKLMLAGQALDGCRVEATENGSLVNSYLYSTERGVVSISLPAFGSEYVKSLSFFLEESQGIFGPQD